MPPVMPPQSQACAAMLRVSKRANIRPKWAGIGGGAWPGPRRDNEHWLGKGQAAPPVEAHSSKD